MKNFFASFLIGSFAAWVFFTPTRVNREDIRQFDSSETLTIKFSKAAPPLAALLDEKLEPVPLEPQSELVLIKGHKLLAAGNLQGWPRLKKVAAAFEKRRAIQKKIYIAKIKKGLIKPDSETKPNLAKMVIAVPVDEMPSSSIMKTYYAKKFDESIVAQANNPKSNEPSTPEVKIQKALDQAASAISVFANRPAPSRNNAAVTLVNYPPARAGEGPAPKPNPSVATRRPNDTGKKHVNAKNQELELPTEGPEDGDGDSDPAVAITPPDRSRGGAKNDRFKILGNIELSGGLAFTGVQTKLEVFWKWEGQARQGTVDPKTGEFIVAVPSIEGGKVVVTLSDKSGLLGSGTTDIYSELDFAKKGILENIRVVVEPEQNGVGAQVVGRLDGRTEVPVPSAEIFGPISVRESTDRRGLFSISGLGRESNYLLEIYSKDYYPTRYFSSGSEKPKIPLIGRQYLDSILQNAGAMFGSSDRGIVWGQVNFKKKPVSGVQINLSSNGYIGPFYFNSKKEIDLKLNETSENGMFVVLSVSPGVQHVFARRKTVELPSALISVAEGVVSAVEIKLKKSAFEIEFKDLLTPEKIDGRTQLIGSSKQVQTVAGKIKERFSVSDPSAIIDFSPFNSNYHRTRLTINRGETSRITANCIKKDWLIRELKKAEAIQEAGTGIIMGVVSGPQYHVAVETSLNQTSDDNVYYLNDKGEIEVGASESIEGAKVFIIINVKPGLHTVTVTSSDGLLQTTQPVVAERGVVNLVPLQLRP